MYDTVDRQLVHIICMQAYLRHLRREFLEGKKKHACNKERKKGTRKKVINHECFFLFSRLRTLLRSCILFSFSYKFPALTDVGKINVNR